MPTFTDFWIAYPRRKGANPRTLAETKWNLAIKKGADPGHIIGSVKRYKAELQEQDLIDTPFVCMASTWLNQRRYLDYAPDGGEHDAKIDEDMKKRGYVWDGNRWIATNPTSEKVMNEAVKIYDEALKSLSGK